MRKRSPPWEHHRSLGIVVLYDPTGRRFLISQVTLQGFPHPWGAVRTVDHNPLAKESSYPAKIDFQAIFAAVLVTLPAESRGGESLVVHRVVGSSSSER